MGAVRELATIVDLEAADRAGAAVELIDGEIIEKAMGSFLHGRGQSRLSRRVGDYDRRDGPPPCGWWIVSEVTIDFEPGHGYRPELSGWRREHSAVPTNRRMASIWS